MRLCDLPWDSKHHSVINVTVITWPLAQSRLRLHKEGFHKVLGTEQVVLNDSNPVQAVVLMIMRRHAPRMTSWSEAKN